MHSHPRGRSNTSGFTLLEAIVALAIIGFALIPLATFVAQAASQLGHVADNNERSFAMQSALAFIDTVNPLEEPAGDMPLDKDVTISWQSTEIIPPNDGVLVGAGLPGFRVGFYGVKVTLSRKESGPWFDFEMRKVGYQRIKAGILPPGMN